MEPFRAFVGDMVSADQRASGYAVQTMFIGAGAVVGSLAPILLTKMGVANIAPEGVIPPSVRYAFYIGAVAIFLAVLWTVVTTREYSPDQMRVFNGQSETKLNDSAPLVVPKNGMVWLGVGVILLVLVEILSLDKQLYVLGGGLATFGIAQLYNAHNLRKHPTNRGILGEILSDLSQMPLQMRRLAVAQFFSWFALFIMWIYTTPVVTRYVFGATDTTSKIYNDGADWVGVLFSIYNGTSALAALVLPMLAKRFGAPKTHMICLAIGALSYACILIIRDPNLMIMPMIGVGITWASILTMPYVILAGVLPQQKLGVYMGIFNFFIVLPQLLVATLMGGVIRAFFPDAPIWTMLIAALVMGVAALAMLRVKEEA
jgi:maltose/moltooligosaccharide transporter